MPAAARTFARVHSRRAGKVVLDVGSVKNTKRSLRDALDDLTTTFVEAVLLAAREALTDRDSFLSRQPTAEPPVERRAVNRPAKVPRPQAQRKATGRRTARSAAADVAGPEAPTELLITDPQALLAALETAEPADETDRIARRIAREESESARTLPDLLEPVEPEAPPQEVVPTRREAVPALRAREGEQVLRSFGSSVVLRRRRA